MANANLYGFRPKNPNAKITWLPVTTAQTLTKGDAVILSSSTSGTVSIALANSAILAGVIAKDCAALAANTLVPVYAEPDEEFWIIADASAASLDAGIEPDIIGATGAMMLDADATTTDVLKVLRIHPDDTAATAYQRVLVRINKHAFAQID